MTSCTDVEVQALLIDGEWVTTGDWLDVTSPYTGKSGRGTTDVLGAISTGR